LAEFISFKGATDALAGDLKKQFRDVLPFAAVVALSRSAVIARDEVKDDMRRVFKNPTPYALGAARAKPATKQTMASAVLLRDFGGTPAENYLGPEIEGGDRHVKASEKALRIVGILPADKFIAPGKGAKLDQYGNQSAGEIVQILSALKAFSQVGYVANRSTRQKLAKRPRPQRQFFVAKSRITGEPLGVYEIVGTHKVAPVMAFVRAPTYHERLDFYGLVQAKAQAAFPAQLDAALTQFGTK